MKRKLFFVSATDVDGNNWEMHVAAVDAEDAFTVWREDQDLSAEDVKGLYPDGVRVWLVMSPAPVNWSCVFPWTLPESF